MAETDTPITGREAARRLSIHEKTLVGWRKRGLIGAMRLPSGVHRYSADEVERMRQRINDSYTPATES